MADFKDLDTGWSWVVMFACFVSLFVIGGTNYTVGLVHNILLEKYNQSQTTTAWVGAVHSSVSNLAAPLSSLLIDQFSVRVAMMTGGILYTIGFLCTAYASSIGVSVFTFGVIAGLGGATGWTASMIAPNFHFEKYRNLAQGISLSGTGAGMFGVPPILSLAAKHYGNFGFFAALACVSAQFIVCGMASRPSSLEIHSRLVRHAHNRRGNTKGVFFTYLKVLTTKSILFYSLSMFAYGFGMYIVFVFLPVYCIRQGSNEMQASYIISVCGVSSIFGRILSGFIANFKSVNEIFLYSGSLAVLAIITVLFPLYTGSFAGQLVYAILLGLFFGCPFVTMTPINLSFVGVGHISAALGLELSGCGAGGIIGPVLAGVLADNVGSFTHVFILAGVAIGISAVMGFVPYFFHEQNQGTSHLTITVDVKEEEKQLEQNEGTSLARTPVLSEQEDDKQSELGTEEMLKPEGEINAT